MNRSASSASSASSGSSAPDRSRPPSPGPLRPFHLPEVGEARLSGGLEIRLLPDGRVPLVSGVLVMACGEASVPEPKAGLAGLAGEVLLGGTLRRSGVELAEALERQGTSFHVSTGWDATSVSFTCTAERLGETLGLLAEVVREPAYPAEEVERVRRQRMAALAQRRADPSDLADDEADRVLYPEGHPWRRSALGTEDSLAGLGPEDAAGWARGAFLPGGGGLVLSGDLDPGEAEALVAEHLGDWSGSPEKPVRLPEVRLARPRPVVVRDRPGAVQTELRVVYPGPPRATADYHDLVVANAILGGSFTSRLNLNLRERHGFTYGVRSGWTFRRRGGEFAVSTAVGTEVTGAALRETMGELTGFLRDGPTEEEVERARDYLAGVFPLRMETAAQRASRVAELLALGLPADTHHRYRDRIREVTRDGAHAAIRAHLDPDRAPIVLVADGEAVREELEALDLGALEVVR
jgi:zinc protease